jgi:hypothetical protein
VQGGFVNRVERRLKVLPFCPSTRRISEANDVFIQMQLLTSRPSKLRVQEDLLEMSFNSTFETAMAFEGTQNIALVAASCFIGITVLLWTWTRDVSDPREPPLLKPRFPVIGHLLGIMQHEAEYFQRIRYQFQPFDLPSLISA